MILSEKQAHRDTWLVAQAILGNRGEEVARDLAIARLQPTWDEVTRASLGAALAAPTDAEVADAYAVMARAWAHGTTARLAAWLHHDDPAWAREVLARCYEVERTTARRATLEAEAEAIAAAVLQSARELLPPIATPINGKTRGRGVPAARHHWRLPQHHMP